MILLNLFGMEVLRQSGYAALWTLVPLFILSVLLFFVRSRRKQPGLPPGPQGLPFVGFLPFLSPTEPAKHLSKLSKTYGNVFGMYMGSEYYLILNDYKSAKEAFNMNEFTYRPEGCFQVGEECPNFASTHGQHWVDHRRIATKHLRQHFLESESMEETIMGNVTDALDRLEVERSKSKDGQVVFRGAVKDAVNNSSYGLLCNRRFPEGHEALSLFSRFQHSFNEYASSMTLERFLPWLKPVLFSVLPSRRRIYKSFKQMESFCWSEIDLHEKDVSNEHTDFMGYYLKEREKTNMAERLTKADLNGDIQMLMFASGDTVRSTLEWYLLLMAEHQDVQEKVYQEIMDVLGSTSEPRYKQRTELPYTEATLFESMRHKLLVPLNPMHSTAKGTVTPFKGYSVPGDSVVIVNLWAIHKDPENWRHPDKFYPEHFLSADRKTVQIPDEFAPFGIGKRICIGDKLALVEFFLFVVRFLQRFKILPPKEGIDMAGVAGITVEPNKPIVRLVPRNV